MTQVLRRIAASSRRWFHRPPASREIAGLYWKHYRLARHEERWDVAMVFLDRLLELNPRDLDARLERAEVRELAGNLPEAISGYHEVIRLCAYDGSRPHCRRAQQALAAAVKRAS